MKIEDGISGLSIECLGELFSDDDGQGYLTVRNPVDDNQDIRLMINNTTDEDEIRKVVLKYLTWVKKKYPAFFERHYSGIREVNEFRSFTVKV